jgi:hypothetical protein
MTGSSRAEELHAEIERQIEVVAELICENKSAVKAQRLLQNLTKRLAAEEVRLARHGRESPHSSCG